jgi:hypothetical protein
MVDVVVVAQAQGSAGAHHAHAVADQQVAQRRLDWHRRDVEPAFEAHGLAAGEHARQARAHGGDGPVERDVLVGLLAVGAHGGGRCEPADRQQRRRERDGEAPTRAERGQPNVSCQRQRRGLQDQPHAPPHDEPDPHPQVRPPPHRVAEGGREHARHRRVRGLDGEREGHHEADRGGGGDVASPPQRARGRGHHQRGEQRNRGRRPHCARGRQHVVLARPAVRRLVQPPRHPADRARRRVPADGRAEGLRVRGGTAYDQGQVARPVVELVDRRRDPAGGGNEDCGKAEGECAPAERERPSALADHQADRGHGEQAGRRRQVHEMRLHDEARHQRGRGQQPMVAAGHRPAQEDQQQEGEQAGRRVPDVMERLGGQRSAHQRDGDRGGEHEHQTTAAARERDRADDGQRVDRAHRDGDRRRAADSRGQRDEPVEHRPQAVRDLPGDLAGQRVLAVQRRVRAQDVVGARRDDPLVSARLPVVAHGIDGGDDHRHRGAEPGAERDQARSEPAHSTRSSAQRRGRRRFRRRWRRRPSAVPCPDRSAAR